MQKNLNFLHAQWSIHYTNFPMWLKGDKVSPTITYGPHHDAQAVTDKVTYVNKSSGKEHSILGVDRITGERQFRWRGAGWLCLLTSDWQIDHLSDQGADSWMIISFQKSLFTPAGHDILCRKADIDEALAAKMLEKFATLHPACKIQRLSHRSH